MAGVSALTFKASTKIVHLQLIGSFVTAKARHVPEEKCDVSDMTTAPLIRHTILLYLHSHYGSSTVL